MEKPHIEPVNGIDIAEYYKHPRILELRLILTFRVLENAYTPLKAGEYIEKMCEFFGVNFTLVNGILNRRFNILNLKRTDLIRFRQEVIFMGMLFNETRYTITNKYLGLSHSSVYRNDYKPENFISQDWLDKLDESIELAGNSQYFHELERLLVSINEIQRNLGYVSISKTKI